MKKAILLIISVTLLMLIFAGCGSPVTPPAAAPAAAPAAPAPAPAQPAEGNEVAPAEDLGPEIELTLGHSFPPHDHRAMAMQYFADRVEEFSGGNVTVMLFPQSMVVTSQDALPAVADGVVDMAQGALSFHVMSIPALIGLDIHGIYDPQYFWETAEVIAPILEEIMHTQNQSVLMQFDADDTIFYLSSAHARDVTQPSDIAGLRIRDHGVWVGRSIAAWGAYPMTVVPADVAVALERGTVDGGYTGWSFVMANRLHESAPHVTFADISKSAWAPMTINLDVYNSLTQGQRDVLRQAATVAEQHGRDVAEGREEIFIQQVLDAGGTVHRMTPEQTQLFVDASMSLVDYARQDTNELGNRLIDALLTAPSRFR